MHGQDGLIGGVLRYGAEACLAIAAILLVDDANSAPRPGQESVRLQALDIAF